MRSAPRRLPSSGTCRNDSADGASAADAEWTSSADLHKNPAYSTNERTLMKPTAAIHGLRLAFVLTLLAAPAQAQQEQDVIELIKSQVATQRQALVAENLNLTAEQSEVFWPLYREFQTQRRPLIDRRISLLKQFSDNFDGLSNDEAASIIDGWIALEGDVYKLRKKYVKKFRKILPEKTTLRYFQIEKKLDTIIEYDLSQVTPLAE